MTRMPRLYDGGRSAKGQVMSTLGLGKPAVVVDEVKELVSESERDQAFLMSVARLIRKMERIDGCHAGILYNDEYGEVKRLLREKGIAT